MSDNVMTPATSQSPLPVSAYHQQLAVQLFLQLMTKWEIVEYDQYILSGSGDIDAFRQWRRHIVIPLDLGTYQRLTAILEIYKLLRDLGLTHKQMCEWLRTRQKWFQGRTPLSQMLVGGTEAIEDMSHMLYLEIHMKPATVVRH